MTCLLLVVKPDHLVLQCLDTAGKIDTIEKQIIIHWMIVLIIFSEINECEIQAIDMDSPI